MRVSISVLGGDDDDVAVGEGADLTADFDAVQPGRPKSGSRHQVPGHGLPGHRRAGVDHTGVIASAGDVGGDHSSPASSSSSMIKTRAPGCGGVVLTLSVSLPFRPYAGLAHGPGADLRPNLNLFTARP